MEAKPFVVPFVVAILAMVTGCGTQPNNATVESPAQAPKPAVTAKPFDRMTNTDPKLGWVRVGEPYAGLTPGFFVWKICDHGRLLYVGTDFDAPSFPPDSLGAPECKE